VQFELSYDKFHKNAGWIYRVSTYVSNDATSSAPLAPVLKETYPEILSIVRISRLGFSSDDKILFLHGDKKILENEVFLADPELFNVLSFEFLKGNPKTALINPNSIIMTEEMAEKYFNNEDPMGKVLSYENSHDFIVTGVLKNFPANSHLSFKFIIPFENNKIILNYNLTNWDQNFCYTYLRLREDANPEELEKKSNALLIEHWFENVRNEHNKNAKLYFFPITSLYLHPPRGGGPFTFLNILMLIAFFILIIACINYINLTTAKSAQRAKEVGIRKVVGAQRNQLVIQLFAESVFISLIAFFLSLIIVMLVLPVFSQFVDRDLDFNLLGNYKFISLLLLVVAFVSLSSSSYPAFYISSFRPITILRGILKTGTKGSMLKNILVVFQFVISIVLIFCSLVIRDQVHFIRNKDIGFDKNQIVNISVRDKNVRH
jgi:putative ABC transport system permease protein